VLEPVNAALVAYGAAARAARAPAAVAAALDASRATDKARGQRKGKETKAREKLAASLTDAAMRGPAEAAGASRVAVRAVASAAGAACGAAVSCAGATLRCVRGGRLPATASWLLSDVTPRLRRLAPAAAAACAAAADPQDASALAAAAAAWPAARDVWAQGGYTQRVAAAFSRVLAAVCERRPWRQLVPVLVAVARRECAAAGGALGSAVAAAVTWDLGAWPRLCALLWPVLAVPRAAGRAVRDAACAVRAAACDVRDAVAAGLNADALDRAALPVLSLPWAAVRAAWRTAVRLVWQPAARAAAAAAWRCKACQRPGFVVRFVGPRHAPVPRLRKLLPRPGDPQPSARLSWRLRNTCRAVAAIVAGHFRVTAALARGVLPWFAAQVRALGRAGVYRISPFACRHPRPVWNSSGKYQGHRAA
jgi:hypothetical protein